MSISFLEQKKKNKLLLPILGGIIVVTLIIIWLGFSRKPESPLSISLLPVHKINIDWQVLKNPILDNLELFEVIQPLQGSYGRKNPFLPY
ncbi:MAG: hypothetical protein AAB451_03155 [Patescibacteria group bacterium]